MYSTYKREHQTFCANRKIPQRLIETNLIQYLLAIARHLFLSQTLSFYFVFSDFCLVLLMFAVYTHPIAHSLHSKQEDEVEAGHNAETLLNDIVRRTITRRFVRDTIIKCKTNVTYGRDLRMRACVRTQMCECERKRQC